MTLKDHCDCSDDEIMPKNGSDTRAPHNRLFVYYYRPWEPTAGKWGRCRGAIALASACLAFLLFYALASMFVVPSGWNLSNIGIFGGSTTRPQIFSAGDPDQFLIGVGKADITG